MRHKQIQKLAFCAIMIALTFVLAFTPFIGMIPLGLVSATTVFIPVIMGIIVLDDYKYALTLGFGFGLVSFLKALLAPETVLDPYFQNPIVSVIPRMLMAICAYFIYKGLRKIIKNKTINFTILGFSVAFLNTLFTISMLCLVCYHEVTSLLIDYSLTWGQWLFAGIALTNMLPEIALGIIVSVICGNVYLKIISDSDQNEVNE